MRAAHARMSSESCSAGARYSFRSSSFTLAWETPMQELRLLFAKNAGGVTVPQGPPSGSAAARRPFDPSLTEKDFEDLRWYLEDYMALPDAGAAVRAERVERCLEDWGRRLFDAVFPEDRRDLVNALLAAPPPRLLTIATND